MNEPDERDVEALTHLIHTCGPSCGAGSPVLARSAARHILASAWYAEHIAAAQHKCAAEALDEAASALSRGDLAPHRETVSHWLRARAASLRESPDMFGEEPA